RVEVLRGPQGTLYGVSSMGGVVKFVTLDPSTSAVSGDVQVGTSSVYNAVKLGYDVHGAINVPLSNTFAIRASGFSRATPGYVDDVLTGQRAVNQWNASGGMFSAVWGPSAAFSLKLTALLQRNRTDGLSAVQSQFGDLKQSIVEGAGQSSRTHEVYAATLRA